MNKVKLTREQADAIEHLKDLTNDLGVVDLADAIYVGYEIEPEFKVGDWVVRTVCRGKNHEVGKIFRIKEVVGDGVYEDCGPSHMMESLRFATPEEIAKETERSWWKKHGRDYWELKEDDILYYDGHIFAVYEETEIYVKLYSGGEYSLVAWSVIKNKYAVACFAEDRKDVDHE